MVMKTFLEITHIIERGYSHHHSLCCAPSPRVSLSSEIYFTNVSISAKIK
jgi:hypothetical protein